MTNVHNPNRRRGTVQAPMVTIGHAEALDMHRARHEAFVKSNLGIVWAVAVTLLGWFLFAGVPAWVVAAVNDSVAAGWWTFSGITAALVGTIALVMRSS
ncbi:MAG: hypothetical protein INR66_23450 [Gordonia polyisoprenivorans]|nr:hypothetical protein [Gordonia polyisoprenivorans]